jgi:bifunctional DNA-binding transcriptional regulator/antitoxin component of YhaV-PrlF toxin-antitoxin module
MTTLLMTKRGGVTLPPDIRRRMGLDRLRHPLLIAEERDGGLFLQPATALPVRDLSRRQIQEWIKQDEAGMTAFRAGRSKKSA